MLKLGKHVYICTLTSLAYDDMLKIDVSPGDYKLTPFNRGYVFTREPNFAQSEIVHIFWTRCGDKGLSGTHWNGESRNHEQIRIFRNRLCKRFDQYFKSGNGRYQDALLLMDNFDEAMEWANNYNDLTDSDDKDSCYNSNESLHEEHVPVKLFKPSPGNSDQCDHCYRKLRERPARHSQCGQETDEDEVPREIKNVAGFNTNHNLPFIFYLNKPISQYFLVDLKETEAVENCGFLYKVLEGQEHIGYVVEKDLHIMMGDEVGLGLYNNAVAFGNFCVNMMPHDSYGYNQDQYERRPPWCSFKKCRCDIKRKYHLKKMMLNKKKRDKWIAEKKKRMNAG